MLSRQGLVFDNAVAEMKLQWGGFGSTKGNSGIPSWGDSFGDVRLRLIYSPPLGAIGASTAVDSEGVVPPHFHPLDSDGNHAQTLRRQIVFTEKGFSEGRHIWHLRVNHIHDSKNIAVRMVVGVATRMFQMGTRTQSHEGVACLLSHAGYVYGTNGFSGKGYPLRFTSGDLVMVELDLYRNSLRFGLNGIWREEFASNRLLTREERANGQRIHGVVGLPPGSKVTMVPLSYRQLSRQAVLPKIELPTSSHWRADVVTPLILSGAGTDIPSGAPPRTTRPQAGRARMACG